MTKKVKEEIVIDITRIWQDILPHNRIMLDEKHQILRLVNLTTNNVVATGKTPSKLLDTYFAKQIKDMDKNNLQEAP